MILIPLGPLLLAAGLLAHAPARAASELCGVAPTDWCPAPPGDPCGRHRDEAACRADLRCVGLPYRGESVVACRAIGRGYASNCPAVGCVSAPGQVRAAPDPAGPFLEAWGRLAGREDGWRLLVSPAFPQSWPPGGRRPALARYAFAQRPSPRVADGADTAAPWARSVETADGGVTVELLGSRLEPLGIQGVRPMGGEEARLAGRSEEVAALLRAPLDPAGEALARAYTCNWFRRQGVVAAAIAPRHPDFLRWLNC